MPKIKSREEIIEELKLCDDWIEWWESNAACAGKFVPQAIDYAANLAKRNFLLRLQRQVEEEKAEEDHIQATKEKFAMRRRPGKINVTLLTCLACFAVYSLVAISGHLVGYTHGAKVGYANGYEEGFVVAKQIYSKDIRKFKVTAYCVCIKCCGSYADGYTASGEIAVGRLCAAGKGLPFGTEIRVPGRGVVRVEDRGSAIDDDCIDLLFTSHDEANKWGVQYLYCEVLSVRE